MKQYIGKRMVTSHEITEEKTPGGTDIIKVTYADNTIEHLSKMMFDKTISSEKCDDTLLREKRVKPVVEMVLAILREWGIKIGETGYFAQLLNSSIDYNSNQALLKLLKDYMSNPLSLDEVDLITIDRILKSADKNVIDPK